MKLYILLFTEYFKPHKISVVILNLTEFPILTSGSLGFYKTMEVLGGCSLSESLRETPQRLISSLEFVVAAVHFTRKFFIT